ncbi:MAG: NAD(P)/FAD-dependent oxidoreductase [Acidimicrobiales bacterium]
MGALELTNRHASVVILEADDIVGGISRTVERDGWRFDIGGHRFFTKVPEVNQIWHEILPDEDFLSRPRLSRIFYNGKYFDYPLKAFNALKNLGPLEALRSVGSYGWAMVRPPKDQSSFEGWVSARFGRRLYSIFFESYTEKVWGIHPSKLPADWAAQRIKNLSLGRAVLDAVRGTKGRTDVTSLIDRFDYPRLGPGMMWEAATERVLHQGATLHFQAPAEEIFHDAGRATSVRSGSNTYDATGGVLSSMPLGELVQIMNPPAPETVQLAGKALRHRDFLTVAIVIPEAGSFPDNWIYIHSPDVRVGRVQNFASWSPEMVKPGFTCLGLEYFVNVGDDLWSMADDDLVALGKRELAHLGLIDADLAGEGWVVRMPKAYPVYDGDYKKNVETVVAWLDEHVENVIPIGRNGMHRYNNQDHSMLTAKLAAENLYGANHDLWAVNVEEDYHEEDSSGATPRGTGRDAPVFPSPDK